MMPVLLSFLLTLRASARSSGEPLFFDSYLTHPETGCFTLIDAENNSTVAAGMIGTEACSARRIASPESVAWQQPNIPLAERLGGHPNPAINRHLKTGN